MNTGYSLLLNEFIDAKNVDYTDCKFYQIVCPACKEPVFKVERKNTDAQYLSHHKNNSEELTEICELRVSNLKDSDIDALNIEAKGQNLKFFLKVFSDMLHTQTSEIGRHINKSLKRSKGYKLFEAEMIKGVNVVAKDRNRFMQNAEFIVQRLADEGSILKTSFSVDKQTSIAWDMFQHLQTPQAKSNLSLLLRFSFISVLSVHHRSLNEKLDDPIYCKNMIGFLDGIIASNNTEYFRIARKMESDTFGAKNTPYVVALLENYETQIIRHLLTLPYFEFLKGIKTSKKAH